MVSKQVWPVDQNPSWLANMLGSAELEHDMQSMYTCLLKLLTAVLLANPAQYRGINLGQLAMPHTCLLHIANDSIHSLKCCAY